MKMAARCYSAVTLGQLYFADEAWKNVLCREGKMVWHS